MGTVVISSNNTFANAQTIATQRNHQNMSQLQQLIAKIMIKSAHGTWKEMLTQAAAKWN